MDLVQQQLQLAVVLSRGTDGIGAPPVRVEVHFGPGLPGLLVVGTSSTVGTQARERVKSALDASQLAVPSKKITINLAPAELPKDGGRFDLPMAIGILTADRTIPLQALHEREFFGELSLTGALGPNRGILPAVIACVRAGHTAVIAAADARAVRDVQGSIVCARTLREVVEYLRNRRELPPPSQVLSTAESAPAAAEIGDFADVMRQRVAKHVLEIAAAGHHHALIVGPPGCGKTMLAQRMPSILPPLQPEQSRQVQMIASVANVVLAEPDRPPLRMPHHSTRLGALLGGGAQVWPGEISLAHHGILLMDEFAEWPTDVLDALRQPLQDGKITLLRGRRGVTYPANFQLIAISNPCPCGHFDGKSRRCKCKLESVRNYQRRLSGPLLDRFDLMHLAPRVEPQWFGTSPVDESSAAIAARVAAARERQLARCGRLNSQIPIHELPMVCRVSTTHQAQFERACKSRNISMRGVHKALRVARTIADLESRDALDLSDLTRALQWLPAPLQIS